MSEDVFGTKTAAERLGVKCVTLLGWARKGKIPCMKIGQSYVFKGSEIEEWIKTCKKVPMRQK